MFEFITAEYLCYLLAPIIALVVQALKNVAIVDQYPKIAVAVLSTLASSVAGLTLFGLDWAMLAECTITPMVGAVGLYEWVVKPAAKAMGGGDG